MRKRKNVGERGRVREGRCSGMEWMTPECISRAPENDPLPLRPHPAVGGIASSPGCTPRSGAGLAADGRTSSSEEKEWRSSHIVTATGYSSSVYSWTSSRRASSPGWHPTRLSRRLDEHRSMARLGSHSRLPSLAAAAPAIGTTNGCSTGRAVPRRSTVPWTKVHFP